MTKINKEFKDFAKKLRAKEAKQNKNIDRYDKAFIVRQKLKNRDYIGLSRTGKLRFEGFSSSDLYYIAHYERVTCSKCNHTNHVRLAAKLHNHINCDEAIDSLQRIEPKASKPKIRVKLTNHLVKTAQPTYQNFKTKERFGLVLGKSYM